MHWAQKKWNSIPLHCIALGEIMTDIMLKCSKESLINYFIHRHASLTKQNIFSDFRFSNEYLLHFRYKCVKMLRWAPGNWISCDPLLDADTQTDQWYMTVLWMVPDSLLCNLNIPPPHPNKKHLKYSHQHIVQSHTHTDTSAMWYIRGIAQEWRTGALKRTDLPQFSHQRRGSSGRGKKTRERRSLDYLQAKTADRRSTVIRYDYDHTVIA